MSGVTPFWDWARKNAHISNDYVTSFLAEFFGTFILCLFAVGAGTQHALQTYVPNVQPESSYAPVLGGCLGLMIAVTLFGAISGGHHNPAVTFGMAIAGKISWIKVPLYWFAQFFGAYLGAGLAYAVYYEEIKFWCRSLLNDPELEVTDCPAAYGIFAPNPRDKIAIPLLDQIIGTSILIMIIMSAVDKRNMKVPTFFYGFLFGLTIFAVNLAFNWNAGGVLNPARDLGPRLMAISVGFWSNMTMTSFDGDITLEDPTPNKVQYWLAPFFGPLLGGAVGSILYVLLIAAQLNDDEDDMVNHQRIPGPPGPPPSQYGYNTQQQQGGPRPDWRNTELRKLPPVNIGPGSPPPAPMYNQNQNQNNNQYY